MIFLSNPQLKVSVLDPVSNSALLGVRYCTGGYIYQIEDAVHGPLLSGPTYPDDFNWFDGQGIPDAFNLSPLSIQNDRADEPQVLIPGIGICNPAAQQIVEPCSWQVETTATTANFTTAQCRDDWAFTVERKVSLLERTVRSETTVKNTGNGFIPLRWFPHPFFPQMPEGKNELVRFNSEIFLPYKSVYQKGKNGFIERLGWPWIKGYSQPLDHNSSAPLVVCQRHPKLGQVTAFCSYVPDFLLIWGNENTFSWEPYLERTVATGQSLAWSIDYQF